MDDSIQKPTVEPVEMSRTLVAQNKGFYVRWHGSYSGTDYWVKKVEFLPGGMIRLENPSTDDEVLPPDSSKGKGKGRFAKQKYESKKVHLILRVSDIFKIIDLHTPPDWVGITEEQAKAKAQEEYDKAFAEYTEKCEKSRWFRFWHKEFNPIDERRWDESKW